MRKLETGKQAKTGKIVLDVHKLKNIELLNVLNSEVGRKGFSKLVFVSKVALMFVFYMPFVDPCQLQGPLVFLSENVQLDKNKPFLK